MSTWEINNSDLQEGLFPFFFMYLTSHKDREFSGHKTYQVATKERQEKKTINKTIKKKEWRV